MHVCGEESQAYPVILKGAVHRNVTMPPAENDSGWAWIKERIIYEHLPQTGVCDAAKDEGWCCGFERKGPLHGKLEVLKCKRLHSTFCRLHASLKDLLICFSYCPGQISKVLAGTEKDLLRAPEKCYHSSGCLEYAIFTITYLGVDMERHLNFPRNFNHKKQVSIHERSSSQIVAMLLRLLFLASFAVEQCFNLLYMR